MASWFDIIPTALGLFGAYDKKRATDRAAVGQNNAAQLAAQIAAQTNQTNRDIAQQNLAAQQAMFEAQLQYAIQQQQQEHLGGFDSAGNRIYWHPERGWVTELSPRSEQIQNAALRQEILNRTVGDRQQRERVGRAQGLQRENFREAGSQLDALRNVRQPDAQQLADLLFARGEQGRSGARDAVLEGALQTQARQGNTSNIPRILSEAAGRSGQDAQTAMVDAMLRGQQGAQQLGASDRNNRAQLYSIFADRASQPFDVPFHPAQVTNLQPSGSNAGASLMQSAFQNAPSGLPYEQPNFAPVFAQLTGARGGLSQAGAQSGLLNNIGALFQTDLFKDFFDSNRGLGNATSSTLRATNPGGL